ncbi:MAG: prenyltransferase/squalene oxidase repeat-containing protein, partial [Planctomycetota bacterium]
MRETTSRHRIIAAAGVLVPALALGSMLAAQETSGGEKTDVPVRTDRQTLLRPPDRPLDERIRPDRVTESDLPPLPERVVLPAPPTFRLASTPAEVPISEDHWNRAHAAIERGIAYLQTKQRPDGGWLSEVATTPTDQPLAPSPVAVAVTALASKAIAQARPDLMQTDDFRHALAFIQRAQAIDGSYAGGALTNYVTSAVVSALSSFQADEFAGDVQDAAVWLQQNQWDQGEGLSARQDWYGGAGYGGRGRPDLSNTQM